MNEWLHMPFVFHRQEHHPHHRISPEFSSPRLVAVADQIVQHDHFRLTGHIQHRCFNIRHVVVLQEQQEYGQSEKGVGIICSINSGITSTNDNISMMIHGLPLPLMWLRIHNLRCSRCTWRGCFRWQSCDRSFCGRSGACPQDADTFRSCQWPSSVRAGPQSCRACARRSCPGR